VKQRIGAIQVQSVRIISWSAVCTLRRAGEPAASQ
jgi:hypothetical protein